MVDTNILRAELLEKEMMFRVSEGDYVFTFDYFPTVSEICHNHKLIYIAWVWDCPHFTLWHKSVRYETNRLFVFDRLQWEEMKNRGIQNVWHLPLATDVEKFQSIILQDHNENAFASEVSFVGSLNNNSKNTMLDAVTYLPDGLRGYMDGLIHAQEGLWGIDLVEEHFKKEHITELQKYVQYSLGDRYESGLYEAFAKQLLQAKTSQLERIRMCSELAKNFDFSLYTGSDTTFDRNIKNLGKVDYEKEMPLVFARSKINIHITIHGIASGISKRVFDVLACGGFLLTNYQPEIAETFVDGEELVMYTSLEDLYGKVFYYLDQEEERKRIAAAGYQKVKELFTYEHQIEQMIKLMEQGR